MHIKLTTRALSDLCCVGEAAQGTAGRRGVEMRAQPGTGEHALTESKASRIRARAVAWQVTPHSCDLHSCTWRCDDRCVQAWRLEERSGLKG